MEVVTACPAGSVSPTVAGEDAAALPNIVLPGRPSARSLDERWNGLFSI